MNWYVAQVMTGKEEEVKARIREYGITAVVPKKRMMEQKCGKWRGVVRVIFPGYVFIVICAMEAEAYYKIRSVTGVIKLLGDEQGPISILEAEVSAILRLTQNGDLLGLSEVFVEGGKINVVSGPLKGLEGKIVKLDARRYRAKVNISLMGESRIVDLPVNVIKKSEA